MIAYYLQIKLLHIYCVIASGGLFLLRGSLLLSGVKFGNHALLRWLSYAIDTTLLTAALMLLSVLQLNPFTQPWLASKIGLLIIYIVLGSYALKRGRSHRSRLLCFLAALTVYSLIYGIARAHHPLAWLA
jgi:uncharacterized membrane protein SirB2